MLQSENPVRGGKNCSSQSEERVDRKRQGDIFDTIFSVVKWQASFKVSVPLKRPAEQASELWHGALRDAFENGPNQVTSVD